MSDVYTESVSSLRTFDLNLLRVFDALMRHRSVSAAAKELGVTSSAISHALARLRRVLQDELFVPGSTSMEPTPLAKTIAPEVKGGMGRILEALQKQPFLPAASARTFHLALSDYQAEMTLAPLVALLTVKAPQIELRVFPIGRQDVVRALDEGVLDVAIGVFGSVPPRLRRTCLYMEGEAVAVRVGHPILEGPLTKERLFAYPHIVVELTGSGERGVRGYMAERQVERRIWIERVLLDSADEARSPIGRVAVTVPYFNAVIPMLERTDMIATLPRPMALTAGKAGRIVALKLPYDALRIPLEALWHERSDQDEGLRWLLERAREIGASIPVW